MYKVKEDLSYLPAIVDTVFHKDPHGTSHHTPAKPSDTLETIKATIQDKEEFFLTSKC